MTEGEVRVGMRVRVPVNDGTFRMGRVEAGPWTKHYVECLTVWTVIFASGHSAQLTAKEMEHPDRMKVGDVVEVNVDWEPPNRVGRIVALCGRVHRFGRSYSPGYLVVFAPDQPVATATSFRWEELRYADAVSRLAWLVRG